MPHPCGAAAWKWPNSNRPPGLLEWAFFPRNPMKNRCLRWGMLQLASRPEGRPCRWFFDSVGMGVPPAKLHEKPSAARFGGADQGVPYQAGFSPLSIRAQLGPLWWGELQPASPSADRTSSPRSPPPSCATSLLSILASLRKPTCNSLILRRSMSSAFECDLCLAAKLQNLR
jgi:hypothetical protein